MFTRNNIRKGVMVVVNKKIDEAQKHHDDQLVLMEAEHEMKKEQLATRIIDGLVGSFSKN